MTAAGRGERRRRCGFTLIEMIVALAIMVMIATVITPVLFGRLDRARIEQGSSALEGLAVAIQEFREDVLRYPGTLQQLVEPITTADKNSCGTNYRSFPPPANEIARWKGPYLTRSVPDTGIPIGIGTVQVGLERVPPISSIGELRIVVTGVLEEDAEALNREIDADDDRETNTIRWTLPDAEGRVTLYYVLMISGC